MKPGDYIEINIGSYKNPKLIKIGKGTYEKERNDLINLKNIGMYFPSHMMSLRNIKKMCSNIPSL